MGQLFWWLLIFGWAWLGYTLIRMKTQRLRECVTLKGFGFLILFSSGALITEGLVFYLN